ncbi:alpha/beta hydrolase [Sphingopyxis sp.]|uniref:alpha/beta fold hydrolase n=1 Tax=Sphingopyxis sp. TaxID=1908224 RepID=UPI002B479D56|nr:alpha/beta hydrolase [Sphingopyxis sp.]HJS09764.1 alpha/beta hydrolase [Sphingopyxis sp.]
MPNFKSDGVDLYFEETGAGDPIIWIHEFAADYRTWEAQVRRFSRDYRCITYNARGYPPSAVPEDPGAYTYVSHRDDVIRLMDHLDIEKAHLVGLSMGAYTGLQVVLEYPHRVRSLVFSSGGSGAPGASREKFRQDTFEGADRMLAEGMEAGAHGLAMGATRIQLLNKDPRGWEEFRRYMGEHSALGSALTLKNYQALRPSLYDYEERLKAVDVPVLLAVGDEDDPVIEASIYLKRTLPRAGLWMHPQTGHGMNIEEPDEYNRRIGEFLSAVERGAWRVRDNRANPGQSVFMGDRAEHRA